MKIWNAVKIALVSIRLHKMCSALTMLGIIIGVAAVIVMVAIGSGARVEISRQIAGVGSNLLLVLPGTTTSGGLRMGLGTAPTLTDGDAQAITEEISSVRYVAPYWGEAAQVVYGNRNWSTIVHGTLPEVQWVRNYDLISGRFFTDAEVNRAARVCVMGDTVARELFGSQNPVGQIIRIQKMPFTVVGHLVPKGRTTHGRDQDDVILVPLSTAQKRLFGSTLPGVVKFIMVQATSAATLKQAETEIDRLLTQRHHLRPGQEKDFSIRNLTELLSAQQETARTMSWLLRSIAFVSLVVGGIGIMNIMLVSVTERTREVGIRMAIGARSRDILGQFLIEAVVLSSVGGLIGIAAGIATAHIMAYITQWPLMISIPTLIGSFLIAGAVGVFFGFYPARKAAQLNPIEALRYE
ncbi:MAG: ABC transporter permease [Deltaproteobacteria bacterium]|nr:MAG: ABC transporter permease [Deltaproteobacteria bacterium]